MRRKALAVLLNGVVVAAAASSLLVRVGSALAANVLPTSPSLKRDIEKAAANGNCLVVMVSLHGCPYCEVVRNSYLAPLLRDEKIPVVQIDMGNRASIESPRGEMTTQAELIRSWGIRLAPTVLFFGRDGTEIAERLVGGDSAGFYGAYLSQRVATAKASVNQVTNKI